MTPSSDSTHSLVSSGSMSGSWLGSPSLITGRRPVRGFIVIPFSTARLRVPPASTSDGTVRSAYDMAGFMAAFFAGWSPYPAGGLEAVWRPAPRWYDTPVRVGPPQGLRTL